MKFTHNKRLTSTIDKNKHLHGCGRVHNRALHTVIDDYEQTHPAFFSFNLITNLKLHSQSVDLIQ